MNDFFSKTIGNPKLAATLLAMSNRPERARLGMMRLQGIGDEADKEEQKKAKAEEVKRGIFGKLLEKGIENGADEDTLQKLAQASGIDAQAISLGGLGKTSDPTEKRLKTLPSNWAGKYTPESVDAYIQSGTFSSLVPVQTPGKTSVLNPGDIMVDSSGAQLSENTNKRQSAAGYKLQVREEVKAKNAELAAKIGKSVKLSDRYALARGRIDENVANGITTATTGDKIKGELDKRRESFVRYDNAADKVLSIIDKNPTAITIGADVAKGIVSMTANVQGLFNLIPGADISDLDLEETDWRDQLNAIAGDNAELRTTMFNLAIQQAVANGLINGRVTNQQIEMALNDMGAAGRSPQAMRRKIIEGRQRLSEGLDIALDGALEDYSDLDRPDPTAESGPPAGVSPEEWDAMTPEEQALFK